MKQMTTSPDACHDDMVEEKVPQELELSDSDEPDFGSLQLRSEGDEEEVQIGWDSGSHQKSSPTMVKDSTASTASHKEAGNAAVKAGSYQEALEHYARGLVAAAGDSHETAVLHSNIAAIHIRMGAYLKAIAAAQRAHVQEPQWSKPLFRLAQANLKLSRWTEAVAAASKGLTVAPVTGQTAFRCLLEDIAVQAFLRGSLAGFQGTCLQVRSAGEEAWLGGPAPYDAVLDGPEPTEPGEVVKYLPESSSTRAVGKGDEDAPLDDGALVVRTVEVEDRLVAWKAPSGARRTSFRSVKEAIAAAEDGDRILLCCGTHNGMGEAICVDKRVLIQGQGQLGETVIDQRSNTPTFRLQRPGTVIHNLVLDQTGFKETVSIAPKGPVDPWHREGAAAIGPLLIACSIKSSGDDAVNVSGTARALIQGCTLTAKKSGARVYGNAISRFIGCSFESCAEAAIKAMDSAKAELLRCQIADSGEEGVVVMDHADVSVVETEISRCKGPGVDASDSGRASLAHCGLKGCVGGAWAWDSAQLDLQGCTMDGGPTHTVVLHGDLTSSTIQNCTITGTVMTSNEQLSSQIAQGNTVLPANRHIGWPMEDGPFQFVPNPYTRKQ